MKCLHGFVSILSLKEFFYFNVTKKKKIRKIKHFWKFLFHRNYQCLYHLIGYMCSPKVNRYLRIDFVLCVCPLPWSGPEVVYPHCVRVMPSSASSIRSHRAWLPTGSCPVPGVEGAGEEAAVWEEDGRVEALVAVTGVPSFTGWREDSGLLQALEEAALV